METIKTRLSSEEIALKIQKMIVRDAQTKGVSLIEEYAEAHKANPKYIQWQICPKCQGQGMLSKPPYIPGDVNSWSGTQTQFTCNLCNGKMVILPFIKE